MAAPYGLSPLRYPGGKSKLAKYIESIIYLNDVNGGLYVEPYAGGSAVALYLLINKAVTRILINDYDKSIYAFWYSILEYTDEFCKKVKDTPITIEQWKHEKHVQANRYEYSLLELGFSTFFLNRTNRSGIIKGGVIGGIGQAGNYKLDCRFNKDELIKRITTIASLKPYIEVYNLDAYDLVLNHSEAWPDKTLIYFDPPYYDKGPDLYVNFYNHEDHVELSRVISIIDKPWIITYDNVPSINQIYKSYRKKIYSLSYTVADKYKGKEVMIFSNNIKASVMKLV